MKKYFLAFLATLGMPFVALAADDYGLSATAGAADLTKYGGDVSVLIGNVVGTALSMIGVIFFVLMIYGGILWMTARGKEDTANKAKETITAAVIGLIIVLASYALTSFVFRSVEQAGGGGGGNQNQSGNQFTNVECVTPDDCGAGFTCENNSCVSVAYLGYCYITNPSSCSTSADCLQASGETCGGDTALGGNQNRCGWWGVTECNTQADCLGRHGSGTACVIP